MVDTVIGIIGGSGVYDIKGLENKVWTHVDSPFGKPSDDFLVGDFVITNEGVVKASCAVIS